MVIVGEVDLGQAFLERFSCNGLFTMFDVVEKEEDRDDGEEYGDDDDDECGF